jgi:hypothetical protein
VGILSNILKRKQPKLAHPLVTSVVAQVQPVIRTHLASYLAYYKTLQKPRFAVLVTGDWGSGKTYQVGQSLPKAECYYVSLFGLGTTDDIVSAVYASMFPVKAKIRSAAQGVSETTAEVPGIGSLAVNGLTSALVGAFLRQEVKTDKPIVFDDLERSGLNVKETLGAINLYVEHHGCRVVVIAHDEKLAETFVEAKEKLFGQTIRVEPQVESAFAEFIRELPEGPNTKIIESYSRDMIGIFQESGVQSLRILRHAINDVARLVQALDQRHKDNASAIADIVRLFCAIDIEWRAGRIKAPDLSDRRKAELGYLLVPEGQQPAAAPIRVANDRYATTNLCDTTLSDAVLRQMLVEGRYDETAITTSVDASSYFVQPQISPPWQIVGNFDRLEDSTVNEAVEQMQKQFLQRSVSDSGEMLHIFSLLMMMASRGILGKSLKGVESDCKAYIDDLLSSGRLPERGTDWRWYDDFETGAYGVGYWITDDYRANFDRVFTHLLAARGKALEATFPQKADELLGIVEKDGQKFFELVCHTRSGDNPYASIPILATIKSADFVERWMKSPKPGWYWISSALKERFKSPNTDRDLRAEEPWLKEVITEMNKQAERADGLAKVRIQRSTPNVPTHWKELQNELVTSQAS